MKPSLDDIKLAVARMIPDHLLIRKRQENRIIWRLPDYSASDNEVNEREWFHACWLVEQTLTFTEARLYSDLLPFPDGVIPDVVGYSERYKWGSSVESRIEALCRIRHPEMFTE